MTHWDHKLSGVATIHLHESINLLGLPPALVLPTPSVANALESNNASEFWMVESTGITLSLVEELHKNFLNRYQRSSLDCIAVGSKYDHSVVICTDQFCHWVG